VNAGQPVGGLQRHRVADDGADVAALGDIAAIAEATHQLRPGARDAAGIPADLGRLAEKPEPGRDGNTRSKASSARPPWAVGSVSGPTTSSSSITEPGSRR
jgi:hypothetical protein